MHPNAALLNKLFTALGEHDHVTMASCYHPQAQFRDIAFDLDRVDDIRNMWRMICTGESDIKVEFEVIEADGRAGRVRLVDSYRFGASKDPPNRGRPVVNAIESQFQFEDGLIRRQDDESDPKQWARQALGGIKGFLAGRIRFLRSRKARKKLDAFVEAHPA